VYCEFCGEDHPDSTRICPATGKVLEIRVSLTESAPAPTSPPTAPAPPGPGASAGVQALLMRAFELYKKHFVQLVITAAVLLLPASLIHGCATALVRGAGVEDAASRAKRLQAEDIDRATRIFELRQDLLTGEATSDAREELERLLKEDAAVRADAGKAAAVAMGSFAATILFVLALAIGSALVYAVAMPLTQAATLVAVAGALAGREVKAMDAWKAATKSIGPLFLTVILGACLTFLGYMLCVLPGLVVTFFLVFVPVVVMLEGRTGMDALKRSFEIVKSDWINVLAVVVAMIVLGWIAGGIGSLLSFGSLFFGSLLADLIQIVVLPFPIVAIVLAYVEARRKTDGFDDSRLAQAYPRLAG
jgi:hypothetical protein